MSVWKRLQLTRNACADWETLVAQDAVGGLSTTAREALATHAATCARCARLIEKHERLTALLAEVPLAEWPGNAPVLPPAAAAIAAQNGGPTTRRRRVGGPSRWLALPLAASLLLVAVFALRDGGPQATPRRMELVSPRDGILPAWELATICATIDPPLAGESVRLTVDQRDVTAASECTPDFVMFTMSEPLSPGEHLVALEILDEQDASAQEELWVLIADPEEVP